MTYNLNILFNNVEGLLNNVNILPFNLRIIL